MNEQHPKRPPVFFILGLTMLMAGLHFAGVYLYFYWRLSNFDKVVHLTAGFLVTLISLLIIYFKRLPKVQRSHIIIVGLFASLVIGVCWELFELYSGITALSDKHYWLDNGGDVVFDLIGGIICVGYFIRKYKPAKELSS